MLIPRPGTTILLIFTCASINFLGLRAISIKVCLDFSDPSESEGAAMVSEIGATASSGSSNQSQIRLLEKELAKYEKDLSSDETSKNTTAAQLVATQITLVESEIAQLSRVTVTSAKPSAASGAVTVGGNTTSGTTSALGNSIDTSA